MRGLVPDAADLFCSAPAVGVDVAVEAISSGDSLG
jgi:hypothetical protein